MTRIEHIGDATLYLGDCREWLESLPPCFRVDAVVTDPPFGVAFKYESHDDDPEAYPEFMREVIALTSGVAGDGPQVFWQGMPNADRWHQWFPPGFRLFAACKGFVQYRPTPVQFSWDPVIFWGKPKTDPRVDRKDFHVQAMAPFGAGRERIAHPCPRPIEQVRYVVDLFTREGDVVLDPFLGSGSTAVACVELGRRFVGCELEPKYFDEACRRLERAARQQSLFASAKPEQPDLLTGTDG